MVIGDGRHVHAFVYHGRGWLLAAGNHHMTRIVRACEFERARWQRVGEEGGREGGVSREAKGGGEEGANVITSRAGRRRLYSRILSLPLHSF